jgi:ATPase family associated with various cellular activities (AAA)
VRSRMVELLDRLRRARDRRAPGTDGAGVDPPAVVAAESPLGALAGTLSAITADYADELPESGDGPDPLDRAGDVFDLDEIERFVLWAAAAPEFDANVGIAYGQLRGEAGSVRCTVGLALELAGVPTSSPLAFRLLGADAALVRTGLVEAAGSQPWLQRRLVVPDPVAAALAGAPAVDPLVSPLRSSVIPLELPDAEVVAAAIEAGAGLVWIRSARGAAGGSLAAWALRLLGIRPLTIDLATVPASAPRTAILRAATREAGLNGCALIVINADVLADRVEPVDFAVLEQSAVPVLVVSARAWNSVWLPHLPVAVDAARLHPEQRARLWHAELGGVADHDVELRRTLLSLRMNPEAIAEAARHARLLATARGGAVDAATVREAARRVSGSGAVSGDGFVAAQAAGGGPGFADLIVPAGPAAALHQLVEWARHRDEVAADGVLRGSGRGLAALFAGNPGTGKTLAANIVANELSMDLLQVDLSTVVDKYIGETEKNLERIFQTAESLDVVLFFDEADALFGSRSEVHDARDRYANQEIAYLLQRMEHFDGITILATNLRGNLDRAFSRRMSFIITFPDPDPAIRGRLWRHHLDQLDHLDSGDPLDLEFLAEAGELTGGDIRNIVRAAAFDAISAGETVGMRHLVVATRSEYRKLGRIMPEHGFTPPRHPRPVTGPAIAASGR